MKLTAKVQVTNAMGLHTRPATYLVKLLRECKSQVWFTYKRETVNAKSILSLLMLAVKKNGKIIVTVEGEDAEKTMNDILLAFEKQFEDPIA